jgi:L-ascorbate metabolism protein UlaG (beta-lactamase superfamily)
VGDTLIKWGIDASKIRQLDWWQDTEVDGIRFVATPRNTSPVAACSMATAPSGLRG